MSHLKYYSYAGHGEYMTKNFGYSQSVNINGVIEISGQGGWDAEGKYPENLKDHIEQAWKNVEAALIDAGGKGLEEVYSINTYHCPMSEESLMVCVEYAKKHMPHKPIWTAVGVPALADPGMKIEIVVKAKSQW